MCHQPFFSIYQHRNVVETAFFLSVRLHLSPRPCLCVNAVCYKRKKGRKERLTIERKICSSEEDGWKQRGGFRCISFPDDPQFLIMFDMNTDFHGCVCVCVCVCVRKRECIKFHASLGQRAHLLHCDRNTHMQTHTL